MSAVQLRFYLTDNQGGGEYITHKLSQFVPRVGDHVVLSGDNSAAVAYVVIKVEWDFTGSNHVTVICDDC